MQRAFPSRSAAQSCFKEVGVRGIRKNLLTSLPSRPGGESAAGWALLVVYGDITLFAGLGKPDNCMLKSRYKRGEPVGFRMTAIDPQTGKREESAELVVHLTYPGATVDIPMRYRGTVKQPELEFWVAKWTVPETAPTGIIRYS